MHHRWREGAPRTSPGRARRARSTWPPAPATSPSSLAARGADVRASTSPSGCWSSPATRRPASTRAGQRARAALRGRRVRRGHCRLRGAQLLRPRPRPGRDGAGHAPGRAGGDPRDHHAAAPAAVLVLPGSGSTGSCPAGQWPPPTRTPTATCPPACGASGRLLAARLAAAGLEDVPDLHGVIIAIHAGTAPVNGEQPGQRGPGASPDGGIDGPGTARSRAGAGGQELAGCSSAPRHGSPR